MFGVAMFRTIRGPAADPGNPLIYTYSAGRFGISWVNTDPTATPQTRIGPAGTINTLSPGTITWDSGGFNSELYVRYYKAGRVTDWLLGEDLP